MDSEREIIIHDNDCSRHIIKAIVGESIKLPDPIFIPDTAFIGWEDLKSGKIYYGQITVECDLELFAFRLVIETRAVGKLDNCGMAVLPDINYHGLNLKFYHGVYNAIPYIRLVINSKKYLHEIKKVDIGNNCKYFTSSLLDNPSIDEFRLIEQRKIKCQDGLLLLDDKFLCKIPKKISNVKIPNDLIYFSSDTFGHDYAVDTLELDFGKYIVDQRIWNKLNFKKLILHSNLRFDDLLELPLKLLGITTTDEENSARVDVIASSGKLSNFFISRETSNYIATTSDKILYGGKYIGFESCESFIILHKSYTLELLHCPNEINFQNKYSIREIYIVSDEKGKYLGDYCFSFLPRLTKILIRMKYFELAIGSFKYCKRLKYVDIPQDFSVIPEECFMNCKSLSSFNFPDNIKRIEAQAFRNCISLKDIELPASIENIHPSAFYGCENLEWISIFDKTPRHTENPSLCSYDGCVYDSNLTTLIICPEGRKRELEIPEGVINIQKDALINCKFITKIILPSTITDIDLNEFPAQCQDSVYRRFPSGMIRRLIN